MINKISTLECIRVFTGIANHFFIFFDDYISMDLRYSIIY